ncbi:MAG TPA: hypothetical protein VFX65_01665, partial [Candidatus Limnocylindrales bacterium]|nr:hypothetical protein [Candidatus Limnocylindrales bacterium]
EAPGVAPAAPHEAAGAPAGETPAGEHPHDKPRALQILSTEHWSLLTARSLAYNEAFSRAGMFLSFLSATLIVIGLMVASDAFTDAVLPVTALLLAVDLFVGLATIGRLANAGNEEFRALKGMNRIRHAYSEMVPGIERYFVTSIHDDGLGVLSNFGGTQSTSTWLGIVYGLTTTVGMLMLVVGVIFAALLGVVAAGLGASVAGAIAVGLLGFLAIFVGFAVVGERMVISAVEDADVLFPTPRKDGPPA